MRIESLSLTGFRNYSAVDVPFDQRCNVIFGDNAQGKTNLLEAIVYLSCGKSPRARSDRELIGFVHGSMPGSGSLRWRRRCTGADGGA